MVGMTKVKRTPLSCLQVILILASLGLYVAMIPLALWGAGRFLIISDPLEPVDAVIALGGDSGIDRLEKAVELYQAGMAKAIIISDTQEIAYTGQDISLYLRNAAIRMGVPYRDIYITEVVADTTYNEARATRKIMLRNDWTSCIVVTDPFHTRRAKIFFRRDFKEHDLSVDVTYTSEHWFRASTWFTTPTGVFTTQIEYIKLLWVLVGGGPTRLRW